MVLDLECSKLGGPGAWARLTRLERRRWQAWYQGRLEGRTSIAPLCAADIYRLLAGVKGDLSMLASPHAPATSKPPVFIPPTPKPMRDDQEPDDPEAGREFV